VGTYLPVIIILGVAISALVFIVMMQLNGWRLPVIGLKGLVANIAPTSNKFFIYNSPNSTAYFKKIGGNYETLVLPWRNYFASRQIKFEELKDPSALAAQTEGVVIIPSALSLSDQERDVILAYRAKGGGVLASWATGTRTSSGDWAGWQFMESLGAKMHGEIPSDSEARHLTLNGESPLSVQQPAGARIWMGKTTEPLLRFSGEAVAARFMTWPRIPDEQRRNEGAIVYTETAPNVGRSVLFAFAETSWESRPFTPHLVIDDTLKWLQREPQIVRASWPNGLMAAQVIEMDTEQEFQNATSFAAMMKGINYRATFYMLTSVGVQFAQVVNDLAREFDIAYHGDIHVSFKDQAANTQEQRIQNMKAELASVLPNAKPITGFRAPTEGYDATTELLLQKHGIRHHAADPSRLEGRVPAVVKMPGVMPENSLVILPRTQRDDINLYWEKLTPEQTTKALIDDFDLAVDTASLGFLSVHSQNFGDGSVLRQALPGFLEHLQKRRSQIWLASSTQVAEWWRDRERIRLTSTHTGKRLDFNITIKGEQPIDGATFTILLPHKRAQLTVQSTKIGLPSPRVMPLDDFRAAVIFDNLKPGDYVYQATFAR
jgi:peptidoglycan/xylan/chitin deacetylase (PgdA/CDA1 family)